MTKTCEHREAISRLAASGMKNSAISSRLGVPLRTVQKIVKQFKEVGHVQAKPGRGRKRTVNTRQMRGIIKRRIDRNDERSLNKMASDLKISRGSLQSIVKNDLKLFSYRLLNGQVLTDKAKHNRKEKCKKLLAFLTVRRLAETLWTDEKVFPVEVAKNPQNHRQIISPAQKKTPESEKLLQDPFFQKVWWSGVGSAPPEKHRSLPFQQPGPQPARLFCVGTYGRTIEEPQSAKFEGSAYRINQNLDVDYLRRTVDCAKKRIEACIKADGGHFENFL